MPPHAHATNSAATESAAARTATAGIGCFAQRMDDVMIVNDMAMLATPLRRPATPQGQQLRRAEEAFKSVVVEPHIETMADQTRWHAVEHAPQHEAATRRDLDARLLIIGRPSLGEWLERRALDLDTLAIASVAPPDHLNEAPVGGKVRELMRTAQQQFVAKHILEVTVRALD